MNLLFLRGIFLTVRNGCKRSSWWGKLHKEQPKETLISCPLTSDDHYNFCLLKLIRSIIAASKLGGSNFFVESRPFHGRTIASNERYHDSG